MTRNALTKKFRYGSPLQAGANSCRGCHRFLLTNSHGADSLPLPHKAIEGRWWCLTIRSGFVWVGLWGAAVHIMVGRVGGAAKRTWLAKRCAYGWLIEHGIFKAKIVGQPRRVLLN